MRDLSSFLAELELVTFDCFGTLVDWAAGLSHLGLGPDHLPRFLRESEQRQRPTRRDAPFVPYGTLLVQVAQALAPDLPPETHAAFSRKFGELPFFGDVPAAIGLLSGLCEIGVISNCDALHQLDVSRRLGVPWDVCVTAEELCAYKPTDRAWDGAVTLIEGRGFTRERWLHVSAWDDYDLVPAAMRGIATAWIGREGGVAPPLGGCDLLFADLAGLVTTIADAKEGPIHHEIVVDAATAEQLEALVRHCRRPTRARQPRFVARWAESASRTRLSVRFPTSAAHADFLRTLPELEGVQLVHAHGRVLASERAST